MRIAFISTYFYPFIGGAENNCYFLARELAKKHEVHVFTADRKGEQALPEEEQTENIHIHRCKQIYRLGYYAASYPSLTKKLLSKDFDIIHAHSIGFRQHDLALKEKKKQQPSVKLVNTPHGPFMALANYKMYARLYKYIRMPSVRKANKIYDLVLQVNPEQYIWMADYGFDINKIKLLPNGIPESLFNQSADHNFIERHSLQNKFVISHLGRVQRYKGLEQVVKVLPEIIKLEPNINFLIMGQGDGTEAHLKTLAGQLNISDNIIFTGQVTEAEKLAGLDTSKVFIFPSEWEAFGISALEAMARKNAVISTRTEGGRYLIDEGKNGFLFDFGNTEQLKHHLAELITNKKLRNEIKINNIKKAKQFTWEKIAKQLERYYEELLKR